MIMQGSARQRVQVEERIEVADCQPVIAAYGYRSSAQGQKRSITWCPRHRPLGLSRKRVRFRPVERDRIDAKGQTTGRAISISCDETLLVGGSYSIQICAGLDGIPLERASGLVGSSADADVLEAQAEFTLGDVDTHDVGGNHPFLKCSAVDSLLKQLGNMLGALAVPGNDERTVFADVHEEPVERPLHIAIGQRIGGIAMLVVHKSVEAGSAIARCPYPTAGAEHACLPGNDALVSPTFGLSIGGILVPFPFGAESRGVDAKDIDLGIFRSRRGTFRQSARGPRAIGPP